MRVLTYDEIAEVGGAIPPPPSDPHDGEIYLHNLLGGTWHCVGEPGNYSCTQVSSGNEQPRQVGGGGG